MKRKVIIESNMSLQCHSLASLRILMFYAVMISLLVLTVKSEAKTETPSQTTVVNGEQQGNAADALTASLKTTIIPSLAFRDAHMNDILLFLGEASRRSDPLGVGFNFRFDGVDFEYPRNAVTIYVGDMSFYEFLGYVTAMASCDFKVQDDSIVVFPVKEKRDCSSLYSGGEVSGVEGKEIKALTEKAKKLTIPSFDFRDADLKDVTLFLMETCRRSDPDGKGINILLMNRECEAFESKITFSIRDLSLYDTLGFITEMAGVTFEIHPNAIVILPKLDGGQQFSPMYSEGEVSGVEGKEIKALTDKAKKITIPRLDFRDADLKDITLFLVETCRRSDPDGKGINILLMNLECDAFESNYTISIRDQSLYEVLEEITEMAGVTFEIRPKAIVILPKPDEK